MRINSSGICKKPIASHCVKPSLVTQVMIRMPTFRASLEAPNWPSGGYQRPVATDVVVAGQSSVNLCHKWLVNGNGINSGAAMVIIRRMVSEFLRLRTNRWIHQSMMLTWCWMVVGKGRGPKFVPWLASTFSRYAPAKIGQLDIEHRHW